MVGTRNKIMTEEPRVRYKLWVVVLTIGSCLQGCSEPSKDDLAKAIVSDTSISHEKSIEALAKTMFKSAEQISAETDEEGAVSLRVVVHPSQDAEVKMLSRSGPSAAMIDSTFVLATVTFDSRNVVRYGRQRNLANLVIDVRHTVLDETGKKIAVEIFGYTVNKDSFDQYLTTGSAMDIMGGEALAIIEKTCVVNYNHFGDISYSISDE